MLTLILLCSFLSLSNSFLSSPNTFLSNNYLSSSNSFISRNRFISKNKLYNTKVNLDYNSLTDQQKYNLQWYVVGTSTGFSENKPHKVTIWDKNYVVWKNNNSYSALDDVCSHKSASLSCGKIINNNVLCPYHGYQFNNNGTLIKVPGINFKHSCIHDVQKYDIVEKNGWVYLNTFVSLNNENKTFKQNIFVEEEALNSTFSPVFLNMDYNCYSRVLSENSLDVMHIAYVHTFGNLEKPNPYKEDPPKILDNEIYHVKTSYLYESGRKSVAKKIFLFNNLIIENEFILPHTTVARVKFGELVSTVITFALPINSTTSRLFVKTYRNFWNQESVSKYFGDMINYDMMFKTMLQDKKVVESIDPKYIDGKFNMKFDKLQNTYVTFYKKLIHNYTKNN
jgi:phenylpropionate dioxygenase-like ring-hydroxylating dioxygenase large terminal subunit